MGRKLNEDEQANFRAMSDLVFKTLDSDQSQEITEQELTLKLAKEVLKCEESDEGISFDQINNSNANNDNSLTKEEVELYTNQKLTELQTKNANAVANAGYSFSKITSEYGELPVYVKDGKTFMVNMDGTVGQEIIPEGPENEN